MKKSRFLGKAAILLAFCALALLTACDNMMDSPRTKTDAELATLSISIEGAGARTVTANRLPEYTEIRLYRGLDGEESRELLGTFSSEDSGPSIITMTPGTYNFSLEVDGVGGALVGISHAENVTLTAGLNELAFSLSPPPNAEGNGYVEIDFSLPYSLGLTSVEVKNSALGTETESFDIIDGYYFNYRKDDIPAGDYLVSFLFYKGDRLVGVTSEIVKVKSAFGSVKDIELTESDFDLSSVRSQLNKILATAEEGGSYTVTVTEDEVLVPIDLWFDVLNVTITLTGGDTEKTLRLDENIPISLFDVRSGVTLILGNNITLRGHDQNTEPLISVDYEGRLVLQEGAKISGNTVSSNSFGGGVNVYNGGIFIMSGGVISGNSSTYGGGVSVNEYGTFTMTGGVISGNTTSSNGGGVWAHHNATFLKTGGDIYGDDATGVDEEGNPLANAASGKGAGVYWAAGYYRNATLGASDNIGTGDTVTNWTADSDSTMILQVYSGGNNPSIIAEYSATALANADRVFEIYNNGEGRWTSYQWYIDGELQSDATSSTYTFNRPSGIYELFVTVVDSSGTLYSGSCRVRVLQGE